MNRRMQVLWLTPLLVLTGCWDEDLKLGVPYRAQERFNYCTAASVLMWRLYDGLPAVSQSDIFNFEGGTGCTNQLAVARAVNHFTYTFDADWDLVPRARFPEIASRQLVSLEQGTPVIAVVKTNHVGVINGGQYHQEGNKYVQDKVLFHDPDPVFGPNHPILPADWLDQWFCPSTHCEQIVSIGASGLWHARLLEYGDSVVFAGGYVPPDVQQ